MLSEIVDVLIICVAIGLVIGISIMVATIWRSGNEEVDLEKKEILGARCLAFDNLGVCTGEQVVMVVASGVVVTLQADENILRLVPWHRINLLQFHRDDDILNGD